MDNDNQKRMALAKEKMHQAKIEQERLEIEDYETLLKGDK